MAKTPEGRQAEVIQMRDKANNNGEERNTETTQEGITKIQENHFDQIFNLHKNTLNTSTTPEADEEARSIATERILERIRDKTKQRTDSSFMQDVTLEAIIEEQNIQKAISGVKKGTVPAKDGFPAEYYDEPTVKNILTPHLQQLYKEIEEEGRMTEAQREASLSTIYKGKGKDKADMKSYRPMSITPTDYRILTHAIQRKLLGAVLQIIGKTQVAY